MPSIHSIDCNKFLWILRLFYILYICHIWTKFQQSSFFETFKNDNLSIVKAFDDCALKLGLYWDTSPNFQTRVAVACLSDLNGASTHIHTGEYSRGCISYSEHEAKESRAWLSQAIAWLPSLEKKVLNFFCETPRGRCLFWSCYVTQ